MEELSLLAESVVQFYAERVRADLIAEHGEPHHEDGTVATFAVIGMGKLGGREINYSSDLDVQFVYSGEGKTTGGMPNTQFFQRLARRIVSQLKVPTLGGSLYELDLRLRPHGRGGPVALAVDAYARYYAAHGELWERQALLRARQVAGDPTVGGRFVAMARAFAYRAPLTAEEITAIYRTRERKEDKAARETDRLHDLKSGYGGLVDIEFLVQMLQLHHGPTDSSLRTTNTREAIRALYEAGHLRGAAASWLLDTYMFLRFVEDRLHIVDNRTLTALPEDDAGMEKLARRLGYVASNGETARERFLLEYHERTRAVRAIFEDVFEDARAGAA
jgi:glutamate-ammonia-ligase adenylyltransferase